jgi:lysophospholipase L1-like esterase
MRLVKFTVLLALLFSYLWFSYIRFYNFIGEVNLKNPFPKNSFVLENTKKVGSIKYIALGDSLSSGVGSLDFNDTFVYLYGLNLSKTYGNVEVLNFAWPGGTTVDVINYQIPQTILEKPNYITLLIGTNDIHNKRTIEDFKEKYTFILNELLTKTEAQVAVIDIPYLGSNKIVYFPFNLLLNIRTKQFNKVILGLVNTMDVNNRIKFIDLYSNTYKLQKENPNYYSSDLFHPSNEGYILWGEIINAN